MILLAYTVPDANSCFFSQEDNILFIDDTLSIFSVMTTDNDMINNSIEEIVKDKKKLFCIQAGKLVMIIGGPIVKPYDFHVKKDIVFFKILYNGLCYWLRSDCLFLLENNIIPKVSFYSETLL